MVIVAYYLLVSYIFDEDYKSSCKRDEKVDHYVRLFLSSCQYFDNNARSKRAEEGKGDKAKSFYFSKPNFMSLLGLSAVIMRYGHVAGLFEGFNEGYVRNLKAEIDVVRHNEEFLRQVLHKAARPRFLHELMDGNAFSGTTYTRLNNVPIYKNEEPQGMIEKGDPFGGMIDKYGKLWLCFTEKTGQAESTVITKPLIIDDTGGRSYCNLWYSTVYVDESNMSRGSREDILLKCHDYFAAVGFVQGMKRTHQCMQLFVAAGRFVYQVVNLESLNQTKIFLNSQIKNRKLQIKLYILVSLLEFSNLRKIELCNGFLICIQSLTDDIPRMKCFR